MRNINRRNFTKLAASVGAYLSCQTRDSIIGGSIGWGVGKILSIATDTPFQYEPKAADIARNIFFGSGENFAVFPAFNNPHTHEQRFNGQRVTKPTAYASQCLQALLPKELITESDEIRFKDLVGKRIVILGSPESNLLARELFEHGEGNFNTKEVDLKSEILFPFHFSKAIDRHGKPVLRKFRPDEPGIQINALLNLSDKGYVQEIPEIVNHVLQEDYAILTSLPAFQSEDDYHSGRRIVSFCGLHVFGTRSINAIFQSETLLTQVQEKSRGLEAWQAKIIVSELNHSSDTANFVWTEPKVRPVEGNFRRIAEQFSRGRE